MANYQRQAEWINRQRAAERRTRFGAFGALFPVPSNREVIANEGEDFYLSRPQTVSYVPYGAGALRMGLGESAGSRYLPAGKMTCSGANLFGVNLPSSSGGNSRAACVADIESEPSGAGAGATINVPQGQAFRTGGPGDAYFTWTGRSDVHYDAHTIVSRRHIADDITVPCDLHNFGPMPRGITNGSCSFVPAPTSDQMSEGAPTTYYQELAAQADALERAQAAAQAQRDLQAAEDLVFANREAADYAAAQAQIAQNALAQQAAALAAAEAYRQIQADAHKQAADYAAQLALLVSQSAADTDTALALANVTAEAEALRQSLAEARAHQAEQQAAYDVALAASQVEIRNQERANAQLDAAIAGADQAAANAAAGGAASSALSSDLLLYGGIAALAAVLILAGD